MSEDTFTNTVEDAAQFEQSRGGGYSRYPEDAPTRAEAAADARQDRQADQERRQRDREARARGEFVPSGLSVVTATDIGLTLIQHGIVNCRVVPVRDGVFWIDGPANVEHPVWTDGTFDPRHFEVKISDGAVWLKGESWYRDPTSGQEHPADQPPF